MCRCPGASSQSPVSVHETIFYSVSVKLAGLTLRLKRLTVAPESSPPHDWSLDTPRPAVTPGDSSAHQERPFRHCRVACQALEPDTRQTRDLALRTRPQAVMRPRILAAEAARRDRASILMVSMPLELRLRCMDGVS